MSARLENYRSPDARGSVPRGAMVAGLSGLLLAFASTAHSQTAEFCVRCSGPDQTYRCKVTGVGPRYSDAAKLFCVVSTTKVEGHAKCTASRNPSCQGIEKVYAYGGEGLPQIDQNPKVQQYRDLVSREQEKFATPQEQGRATLFDLGKGMISGTKSRLGYGADDQPEAGLPAPEGTSQEIPPSPSTASAAPPATGSEESFRHRSYRCLKSFFFNCGSDDATN